MTIDVKYYMNQDKENFGSSLANLLLLQGDIDMAKKVYNNFMSHDFVKPDGSVYATDATRLISNLTDDTYQGRLYMKIGPDFEEGVRKFHKNNAERIISIFNYELFEGRIVNSFKLVERRYPVMFMVSSIYNSQWVVAPDDTKIINNGSIIEYDKGKQPLRTMGILEVKLKE